MQWGIDGRAFVRDLHALEAEFQHDVGEAMKYAVEEAERHAKATSLFADRTGLLRNSISSWYTITHGELSANAPYAKWVEDGTRPHPIVGSPWLRFILDGEWVKFHVVKHPGTSPRPFMEQAGRWGEVVLYDGLSAFTRDTIRKFNAK